MLIFSWKLWFTGEKRKPSCVVWKRHVYSEYQTKSVILCAQESNWPGTNSFSKLTNQKFYIEHWVHFWAQKMLQEFISFGPCILVRYKNLKTARRGVASFRHCTCLHIFLKICLKNAPKCSCGDIGFQNVPVGMPPDPLHQRGLHIDYCQATPQARASIHPNHTIIYRDN